MTFLTLVSQNFVKVQLPKSEALKTLQSSLGSMVDKFKTLNQRLINGSLKDRTMPVSEISHTQEHLIQVGKLVTLANRVFHELLAFKEGFKKPLAQIPSEEQPSVEEFEKLIQSDPTVQSLEMVYRELLAMRHIQESLFNLKCDKKETELERDQLLAKLDEIEPCLKSTQKVAMLDAILNMKDDILKRALPQQQKKYEELVQKIAQFKAEQKPTQEVERELEQLLNQTISLTNEDLAKLQLTGYERSEFSKQVKNAKQVRSQVQELRRQVDEQKAKVKQLDLQIEENTSYMKFFDQSRVDQLENYFSKTFEMSEIVQKIFE